MAHTMRTLYFFASTLKAPQVANALKTLGLQDSMAIIRPNAHGKELRISLPEAFKSSRAEINQILRPIAKSEGFDFAVLDDQIQPGNIKLLAMDMDSTLITIECIDEIADFVGKKREVSEITEAAMRGEIKNFSESLNRRVALLKGVPASALESVYQERLKLSPGAEDMLAYAKNQGWKTLLVSGGFTFFTDKLKTRLGLDYTRSNTLEIVDGQLTGRVLGTIVDATVKKETLLATCAELGCTGQQAIAMGDGANDLEMMSVAGVSVAFRAKPAVQEKTDFCINQGGLEQLTHWFGK